MPRTPRSAEMGRQGRQPPASGTSGRAKGFGGKACGSGGWLVVWDVRDVWDVAARPRV